MDAEKEQAEPQSIELINKAKPNKNQHDYDDIMNQIGTIGYYQVLLILAALLSGTLSMFHNIAVQFIIESPKKFWCYNKGENSTNRVYGTFDQNNEVCEAYLKGNCTNWDFDVDSLQSLEITVVTQFQLYCEPKVTFAVIKASFFMGAVISMTLAGHVSDKFGRKRTALISTLITLIGAIGTIISPNIYVFIGLRILMGISAMPAFICGFVLASELVGIKSRAMVMPLANVYFDGQKVLIGVLVLIMHSWINLHSTSIVTEVLALAIITIFVPESPRWQIVTGNNGQAGIETLKKLARKQKRSLPDDLQVTVRHEHKGDFRELFRSKNITTKTLSLSWLFLICSMTFNAIYLNVGKFETTNFKPHHVLLLFAGGEILLVDLPMYFFNNNFGRRLTQTISCLLSGSCLLLASFIEGIPKTVCGLISIVSTVYSLDICFVRGTELLATPVRNIGMGFTAAFGRIGGCIFPFIDLLEYSGFQWIPGVVYGCLMLVCGLVAYYMPETANKAMPETTAMAEQLKPSLAFKTKD